MTVVFLTGGSGQLGRALRASDWGAGVSIAAPARGELDLADVADVADFVAMSGAAAILNAAAYTAVDQAQGEEVAAFHANAAIPGALAEAARRRGVPLVHVSSDYVFDGALGRPYEVDDAISPINVYGASKAAGEGAVSAAQPRSAIVRSSWLIGPEGKNFATTMLRLARERDVVRVVSDQRGTPTVVSDLAATLVSVTLRMIRDEAAPAGIFHAANAGDATWADLASEIFAQASRQGIAVPAVEPIGTADYPTPARRPADSRLSTARIERDHGLRLPEWRARLPALVRSALSRH